MHKQYVIYYGKCHPALTCSSPSLSESCNNNGQQASLRTRPCHPNIWGKAHKVDKRKRHPLSHGSQQQKTVSCLQGLIFLHWMCRQLLSSKWSPSLHLLNFQRKISKCMDTIYKCNASLNMVVYAICHWTQASGSLSSRRGGDEISSVRVL